MEKPTARPLRFITATSLFDGHDASINVIRRLLVRSEVEVVHLGHNRSCGEIVQAAIEEDADAIAVSSYQGGHMEFFAYILDLLKQNNCFHIAVFGGGGGVIVPDEIAALEAMGVKKIYSPADGQRLGLLGMIADMLERTKKSSTRRPEPSENRKTSVSKALSLVLADKTGSRPGQKVLSNRSAVPVIGITGAGGAGKSSLLDELVRRFVDDFPKVKIAILAVDPQKKKTGGALLGDRIRMNAIYNDNVFLRSISLAGDDDMTVLLSRAIDTFIDRNFQVIFCETAGIGQLDTAICEVSPLPLYVMTHEYGADTQLEKINMLDYAKLVVINKFETKRSEDALAAVRKQYRRNFNLFEGVDDAELPVFGTAANRFDDEGVNCVYLHLLDLINEHYHTSYKPARPYRTNQAFSTDRISRIIPQERLGYLAEIVAVVRSYKKRIKNNAERYDLIGAIDKVLAAQTDKSGENTLGYLGELRSASKTELDPDCQKALEDWHCLKERYAGNEFSYTVRDKEFKQEVKKKSLSGLAIPKVALPCGLTGKTLLEYLMLENAPGNFPYTAGVFPFKRTDEDPKRQFAGEGSPERTNARFHLLCRNESAKRLSTAFDSVTLYGEDPDIRPDIFGKIGESGVSIATLDDMKKLYAGFDLLDPNTSVSMTINGPAPVLLAMFFNTAIDQQIEKFTRENQRTASAEEIARIRAVTLSTVRGTVQADILKEDQAQNTCIFSTDFALRMMADMEEYAIDKMIRNYYTVSISGYHIAEAGACPVTQLAFTLSNGFTLVEYYLNRGMSIDAIAPNLSFFFSSGLDPEYSVIGRVARRIWAIALKYKYGANERSQKLKYHIQTSGRSLHAQEIKFNDIRTTLQALTAISDNCNSLHTNAYDEAITTPTEQSVKNALAIQMILGREFGPAINENNIQGSYFYQQLTELVEDAVLELFLTINNRGGTLKAMESQYHRSKIQDESLVYEQKKHSGELSIVGVNYFTDSSIEETTMIPLSRATKEEKQSQIDNLNAFKLRNEGKAEKALKELENVALGRTNIFAELMETVRYASLGQITKTLYRVGGEYRRSM